MNDMFSKISELLSDPEASQKIRQIASSLSESRAVDALSGDRQTSSDGAEPTAASESGLMSGENITKMMTALQGGAHSRDLALLNAVKPYLRASRAARIDSAIRAVRMIDLISGLR